MSNAKICGRFRCSKKVEKHWSRITLRCNFAITDTQRVQSAVTIYGLMIGESVANFSIGLFCLKLEPGLGQAQWRAEVW